MARTPRPWSWCFFMASICLLMFCCKSDQAAVDTATAFHDQKKDTADIVGKAVICFNDRYIYSSCQDSFRLGGQGTLNVPPQATDTFCNGPCLKETNRVLRCVDDILYNFRFYNGASVGDVRFAMNRGCGLTSGRGDFNVLEHLGGDGYYGDYYYNHGNKIAIPTKMLISSSVIALFLWVN